MYNGQNGIVGAILIDSLALFNNHSGFYASSGGVVSGCSAREDLDGITAYDSLVTGNVSIGNERFGITAAAGAAYAGNQLIDNGTALFQALVTSVELGDNTCDAAICP